MSTPRFYCATPLRPHHHVELPEKLAHYALRVLRLKNDADIILFDGQGGEYPARLSTQGKHAGATTGAHNPREAELRGRINLVQGLASADKMDWIIEKAVELGASRVTPVTAQRSVLQLRGERLEKRVQHWQRIAQSASEQCGRNRIMTIDRPCSLTHLMDDTALNTQAVTFLCHPDYGMPLHDAIRSSFNTHQPAAQTETLELNLMVGPEGGWSESEIALARQHHVEAIRFGSRILRTETAGLALIAASTALLRWNND